MDHDEIKEKRRKRRKKIIFPLMFVLFTLSINVYAWFVFVSQASLNVDMSVASWDVDFTENNVVTNSVHVAITDMMPGMLDYSHTVQINNNGDVPADLTYWLTEMKVLGNTINVSNSDQVLTDFKTKYPFVLEVSTSSDTIAPNDSTDFNIELTWEYENTSKYYKLNNLYLYKDDADTYFGEACGKYEDENNLPCIEMKFKIVVQQASS